MAGINQEVWKILSQDASILRDMKRNVLNHRGLAKWLIKQYHLDASLDAVLSAIRRFDGHAGQQKQEKKLDVIFRRCRLFTKDGMACVVIPSKAMRNFFHDIRD